MDIRRFLALSIAALSLATAGCDDGRLRTDGGIVLPDGSVPVDAPTIDANRSDADSVRDGSLHVDANRDEDAPIRLDAGGADACGAIRACDGRDLVEVDTCTGDMTLVRRCPAACAGGVCSTCVPGAGRRCFSGDVYSTDSCGNLEGRIETCPDECTGGECVRIAGCNVDLPGTIPGSGCLRGTTCSGDLECRTEIEGSLTVEGESLEFTMYSGSMCGDICDPATDTCGECASCSSTTRIGNNPIQNLRVTGGGSLGAVSGVCRLNCDPSTTSRGGCRDGYTCDPTLGVCVEGCESDDVCALTVVDGAFALDEDSPWTCNEITGRCEHPGTAGAGAGDDCDVDDDCGANGTCIDVDGGICSRFGCIGVDFACGAGEACSVVGFGGESVCLEACDVAAEPLADALGVTGHGAGCRTGYSCTATGFDGPDTADNGVCFPGNYNATSTPNVGEACESDDDCYSPFGYGRCLFDGEEEVSGICSVANCFTLMDEAGATVTGIYPGIDPALEICDDDADQICVSFGGLTTFCLQGCDDATDCPSGYACPRILDGDGAICWPNCELDADCRTSESCVDAGGGTCAVGEDCYCQPD